MLIGMMFEEQGFLKVLLKKPYEKIGVVIRFVGISLVWSGVQRDCPDRVSAGRVAISVFERFERILGLVEKATGRVETFTDRAS
jgi:hypothetical protein